MGLLPLKNTSHQHLNMCVSHILNNKPPSYLSPGSSYHPFLSFLAKLPGYVPTKVIDSWLPSPQMQGHFPGLIVLSLILNNF